MKISPHLALVHEGEVPVEHLDELLLQALDPLPLPQATAAQPHRAEHAHCDVDGGADHVARLPGGLSRPGLGDSIGFFYFFAVWEIVFYVPAVSL